MTRAPRLAAILAALAVGAWGAGGVRAAATDALPRIVVDGSINPAVAEYVRDAVVRAQAESAPALVLQLDTPGGLLQSARAIVKEILGAPVPVIVFVAPSGAGAGSAGVFITLAGTVAAMAPGTSIGAAHPVGGGGKDIEGAMGEKIENFTASFGEAIAKQRGRNVEWASKAVRDSVSITADDAVAIKVVDVVARDLDDLVRQIAGRTVDVNGTPRVLDFTGVQASDGHVRVQDYEMRLSQRFLNVLADPNIAYLLFMAGLLGLYVEFTHPGVGVPGVVGAICLLLGLTALHVLSVNYGGLALIVLGAGLLVAEAFMPTFGLLGVGGLVSVVLGSLFLFDTANTGLAVARSLIAGAVGGLGLFMLLVSVLVVRSQRRRAEGGSEGMVGKIGVVREALQPRGMVLVRGEYWSAIGDERAAVGEDVEVTAVDGLTLRVRRRRSPSA